MSRPLEMNFAARRAEVLHPANTVREELIARLNALGLSAGGSWPPDPQAVARTEFLFVDIDTGHDALFPWGAAPAPVPVIGLVRSEAPGRLSWALARGVDAFMPLSAIGNVFSTLVIAAAHCSDRIERAERDAEMARRNGLRHVVLRAVIGIMARENVDDLTAFKLLRDRAMRDRLPLEDAAVEMLAETGGRTSDLGR